MDDHAHHSTAVGVLVCCLLAGGGILHGGKLRVEVEQYAADCGEIPGSAQVAAAAGCLVAVNCTFLVPRSKNGGCSFT